MTDKQKKILNDIFYNGRDNAEIRTTAYIAKAETLDTLERVESFEKSVSESVKRMQKAIEQLQVYRLSLFEQYNYLKTAPVEKIIKFKREKSYNDKCVYYYLREIDKNLDNQKETIVKSTRYSGKDRKKAFEDFQQYIKLHPSITVIQETQKASWEK